MGRMKRRCRQFVGIIGVIACVQCGCAPLLFVSPSSPFNKDYELEADLSLWCDRGVRASCIDLAYVRLREDSHNRGAHGYMDSMCREGHGSACYYLMQLGDEGYESMACQLHDLRACYLASSTHYRKSEPDACVRSSRKPPEESPDTIDQTTPMQRQHVQSAHEQDVRHALNYCYKRKQAGLSPDAASIFQGSFAMTFELQAHADMASKPMDLEVTCATFPDREVTGCVKDVFEALEFPFHENPEVPPGKQLLVTYDGWRLNK